MEIPVQLNCGDGETRHLIPPSLGLGLGHGPIYRRDTAMGCRDGDGCEQHDVAATHGALIGATQMWKEWYGAILEWSWLFLLVMFLIGSTFVVYELMGAASAVVCRLCCRWRL